ncbi:GntR family transcriptional regulator [Thioclava sp. A2]|uniref:GntR family transcriptional regulator n=1 Tax=Thioclava sp. FCG-A2 TaxID=3080562 RepID=UPI002953A45C|nr:GntR family transcriptional regulator [Thioclava sp. A2]MDV7269312.1 GntR family transcriptional regulator [Thioclava sp. A2]
MSDAPISWQSIRDTMMRRIRTRVYAPGALIPNETELATEFGCARATVNRALQDLAASGFLDRKRKAGTRVMAEPRRKASMDIPLIRAEVEARGQTHSYRLLLREEATPPAAVAAQLHLKGGERLLHVQSLHLADDRPHMFEDRWIVLDTVPALTDADLSQISPNEWLLREAPYTHGTIELAAACAGDAGGHLQGDPQTPALSLLRVTWMHETAITFVTQIFAPDYRLSLDL